MAGPGHPGTQLSSPDELRFQAWAHQNGITDVDAPDSYYDYRGFWRETKGASHEQGTHFPDTYKLPGHPTFSVESKYYVPGVTPAGSWDGDTFIPPGLDRYFRVFRKVVGRAPNTAEIEHELTRRQQAPYADVAPINQPAAVREPSLHEEPTPAEKWVLQRLSPEYAAMQAAYATPGSTAKHLGQRFVQGAQGVADFFLTPLHLLSAATEQIFGPPPLTKEQRATQPFAQPTAGPTVGDVLSTLNPVTQARGFIEQFGQDPAGALALATGMQGAGEVAGLAQEAMHPSPAQARAELLAKKIGGATLDPAMLQPTERAGYAVADPATTRTITPEEDPVEVTRDWLERKDVQHALRQPGAYVGTWRDPETGAAEINVTQRLHDEGAARRLGLQRGEKAIGQLAEGGDYVGSIDLRPAPALQVAEPSAPNIITAPNIDAIMANLPPEFVEQLGKSRKGFRENVLKAARLLPEASDFVQAAIAGAIKRGWYRNSREAITDVFRTDAPRFGKLDAALSPQDNVASNLANTLSLWEAWVHANRPVDLPAVRRLLRVTTTGEADAMRSRLLNAYRVLAAQDPRAIRLSGPKVHGFGQLLTDEGATMHTPLDTKQSQLANIRPKALGGHAIRAPGDPFGKIIAPSAPYLAYNARLNQAGGLLSKLTGDKWAGSEVQETGWSWLDALQRRRSLMEEGAGEANPSLVDAIPHVTPGDVAEAPDFATLLRQHGYDVKPFEPTASPNLPALDIEALRRLARNATEHSKKNYQVKEETQHYSHAELDKPSFSGGQERATRAFGSPQAADAAAHEVAEVSGPFADASSHDVATSPERLAFMRGANSRAWVDIRGKKVRGAKDVFRLLYPFRSPKMERFHVLLLNDEGRVVSHTMETSGALNYVQFGDDKRWVQTVANRARRLGAKDVIIAHNHPSGDPTASPDDGQWTAHLAHHLDREGIRLREHLVLDHDRFSTLTPYLERDGVSIADQTHFASASMAAKIDWTDARGPNISGPRLAAELVRSVGHPVDRVDVLYLSTRGHAIALEPHRLSAVETIHEWLPQRMRAHGAAGMILVVDGSQLPTYYSLAGKRLPNVYDIIATDNKGGYRSAATNGYYANNPVQELRPSHRVFEGSGRPGSAPVSPEE